MKAPMKSAHSLNVLALTALLVAALAGCAARALSTPDLAPRAPTAETTTKAASSETRPGDPSVDVVVSPTVFIVEEELCILKDGTWVPERSECRPLSVDARTGLAAR
jgi:hypothetical protein